jgi:hypothetical protein
VQVNRADLDQLMADNFKNQLAPDQELVGANDNLVLTVTNYNQTSGQISANLEVKAKIAPKLDEQGLKSAIKNRNGVTATEILKQNDAIEDAKISFWPFFSRRVPYLGRRIIIQKQYATGPSPTEEAP